MCIGESHDICWSESLSLTLMGNNNISREHRSKIYFKFGTAVPSPSTFEIYINVYSTESFISRLSRQKTYSPMHMQLSHKSSHVLDNDNNKIQTINFLSFDHGQERPFCSHLDPPSGIHRMASGWILRRNLDPFAGTCG